MLLSLQAFRGLFSFKGQAVVKLGLKLDRKNTAMDCSDGAQPSIMQNKKILGFLQSVVMMPLVVTALPAQITPVSGAPTVATVLEQMNILPDQTSEKDPLAAQKALEAAKIEAYFRSKNMPLADYAEKMVEEAYKNDLDPFLLPAIAVRESTGGRFACKSVKNSPFGYGSCKISYKTMDASIEAVAKSLGGNNPNTARHYAGKTTQQILKTYNPDSIVKGYSLQVMAIMDKIETHPVDENTIQLALK